MPTYDFVCEDCQQRFDIFLTYSEYGKQPVLCAHCGNCTRCPYQAITLDGRKVPLFDPALCIGCSLCARKCFAGAISMRSRTRDELDALQH